MDRMSNYWRINMEIRKVNIKKKADLITELHSYKVIAQMNDYYFKLVKAKGISSGTSTRRLMRYL